MRRVTWSTEYRTYAWVYLTNSAIIGCPGHVKLSRATPRCASQWRRKASVRKCKTFLFRQQQQCQPRRVRFKTCPIDRWSSCGPALHAWPLVYRSSHPWGTACRTKGCCRTAAAASRRCESRLRRLESCILLISRSIAATPTATLSSTNPFFTPFLTHTPIMLTKELLHLPDAPSLLAQRCKLWRELPEHHHLRFVTVCGLRVVCIPTISYLHCQNKPQNS